MTMTQCSKIAIHANPVCNYNATINFYRRKSHARDSVP